LSRSAVSAVTPASSLASRSIRVRGTPPARANAPGDIPSGTRNSSRRTSPGCIGASFFVISVASMIVGKFDGFRTMQMCKTTLDTCQITFYITNHNDRETMIESFKHKGLRQLFEDDSARGVNAEHLRKIRQILGVLHAAETIEALQLPTFGLHPLKGDLKGFWAVTVRANWRIIFRFEDGKASDVDLVDYH